MKKKKTNPKKKKVVAALALVAAILANKISFSQKALFRECLFCDKIITGKGGDIKMKKKGPLSLVAFILLLVGGLNWGLVGFFKFDLVVAIFGDKSMLTKIIYDLVGLAALFMIVKKFMMMGEEKTE